MKAAGLVETLQGAGPVHRVRADQRGVRGAAGGHGRDLLKPENKPTLTKVLTYHVVAGRLTSGELKAKVTEMGGAWSVRTVSGET